MDSISSSQVKEAVARDLKQRHYTQKEASERIGFTRQAFYNLMSREGYFTEKQAILLSLAFGYDKEFLMKGEGELSSVNMSSQDVLDGIVNREKLISILKEAISLSREVLTIAGNYVPKDIPNLSELIAQTKQMQHQVHRIQYPYYLYDEKGIPCQQEGFDDNAGNEYLSKKKKVLSLIEPFDPFYVDIFTEQ